MRKIRNLHQTAYASGGKAMRLLAVFLLGLCVLSGCRSGMTAAERASAKREKFVADSIKYAAVKEAFVNGQFVFRMTQARYTIIWSVDNWIMFNNGEATIQYHWNRNIPPHYQTEKVTDPKLIFNDKEHTITRTGTIRKIMPYFQLTLLEGSDKAFGALIDPKAFVEGYIEPLSTTDIVKNKQFIGFDWFRKI